MRTSARPRLPDGDCVFISDRWDRITKRAAGPTEHGLSAGVRRLHVCDTSCPFVTSCSGSIPMASNAFYSAAAICRSMYGMALSFAFMLDHYVAS